MDLFPCVQHIQLLGKGGFGVVVRAGRGQGYTEEVAIKFVVRSDICRDTDLADHPTILTLDDLSLERLQALGSQSDDSWQQGINTGEYTRLVAG